MNADVVSRRKVTREGRGVRVAQLCKQIKLINREERGRASVACLHASTASPSRHLPHFRAGRNEISLCAPLYGNIN